MSASVVVLALVGLTVARVAVRTKRTKTATTSANPRGNSALFGAFSFPDQRGTLVDNASLNGHVWIADFIYTTCTSACPLITSRFVTLQRRLADERLRFVSFSVDPERDTEATLAEYAARWANAESRWQLLCTNQRGLEPLLARLNLALEREQGQLVHTSRLFLVGTQGNVVASYDSQDDDALDQLVSRTRQLLGVPQISAGSPSISGTGADLFTNLGCAGCHSNAQLAPPLNGVSGSHVMLERAGTVPANDAYLMESIAYPGSQLVAGYPNSMPSYGRLLAPQQLQSLVAYLHTLPAKPTADQAPASAQTDPVCGMAVRITPQTPSAEYQGKFFHFCSPACATRFKSSPQKYLRAKQTANR